MRDPVLIVTGPPGAGKSATARALAGSCDRAVHVEADLFFRFIQAGYVEPWRPESHEQNTAVMRIVAAAAAGYADASYFTIIDGIVIPRWFLDPLREALERAGHSVAYAVLRAPLPVCVSRAAARADGTLADAHVISQLWAEFTELGALESHVIETDTRSVPAIAELVMQGIRGPLLLT